jgi:hypothetical protein
MAWSWLLLLTLGTTSVLPAGAELAGGGVLARLAPTVLGLGAPAAAGAVAVAVGVEWWLLTASLPLLPSRAGGGGMVALTAESGGCMEVGGAAAANKTPPHVQQKQVQRSDASTQGAVGRG